MTSPPRATDPATAATLKRQFATDGDKRWGLVAASSLVLIALLLFAGRAAPALPGAEDNVNLLLVLVIGLTAGGLSCLAVQGGLLATAVAQREQRLEANENRAASGIQRKAASVLPFERELVEGCESPAATRLDRNAAPILWFLGAKLVAYAVLGALLGAVGALAQPTPEARAVVQGLTALLMIATALHFLGVHPIFRYAILQPPSFLLRRIRRTARGQDAFAPALLGALTVFLPCGVTQAIALLAVNSGSAVSGSLIMSAFVLGTVPLFFSLGYFATKLGAAAQARFLKFAAVAILAVALVSLNAALALGGAPITFDKVKSAVVPPRAPAVVAAPAAQDGVQEVRITATAAGYSPARVQIRSGAPARIVFVGDGSAGCALALVFQDRQYVLSQTQETTVDVPAQSSGMIDYSCSMGMYGGSIEVI